jgi:hypothetical protein
MSPSEHSSPRFDAADEEVVRYRALSSLAVAGLLAGLLSPLAMFAVALWLVPLAAVLLSAFALRRIATRWPALIGRPAALAGLMLGAAFLVAAPVDNVVYRYYLRQQARQFAEIWIDAVRHGQVYKAHQLMIDPNHRVTLENNLADFYRKNETQRHRLKLFVDEPTMRTLFALGPDARIRFYETAAEVHRDVFDMIQQIYAVTYPDVQQQPRSFFITLLMQRSVDANSGRADWTLIRVDGGVRPPGW